MTQHGRIVIDLREAYDAKAPSLPEIETIVSQLMRTAGRTVSVSVLRESAERVYGANVHNLLTAIQAGDKEGTFLRDAFLKMAAPERDTVSPDLSELRDFSDQAQSLFTWIFNYRRQSTFSQERLDTLVSQVDAIVATGGAPLHLH